MKRATKVNKGPKNPRNRKELAEKAQVFITECEKSLIRVLEQKLREEKCSWLDLEKELEARFVLLRFTYPNHKGKIAVAIHNVELALAKVGKEKGLC